MYDFASKSTDTILLSTIDSTINGHSIVYRCILQEYGTTVDTGIFEKSDTALLYHSTNPIYSYLGTYEVKFPFVVGDKWAYLGDPDTSITANSYIANYPVLSTHYNVYFIKRQVSAPNFLIIQDFEISSSIGMVSETLDVYTGASPQRAKNSIDRLPLVIICKSSVIQNQTLLFCFSKDKCK